MTSILQVDLLKRLASSARAARDAAIGKMRAFTFPTPPTTAQDHPAPANVCPPPQSILADLIKLGLRAADARNISQAFQRTALGLKTKFEAKHAATRMQLRWCNYDDPSKTIRLNNSFTTTLVFSYTSTLDKWRSAIIDKVRQRICQIRDARLLQGAQSKKSFNVSAVPILEEYFVQNSRPSRAEKRQLAAQTSMDYKQITVWFQNRRNRSKQDTPATTPTSETPSADSRLPPDLAAALARILAQYDIIDESSTCNEEEELVRLAASFAPFRVDRPEHAWPVAFPPLCSKDPFPPSANARGLSTPWYRFPAGLPVALSSSDESDLLPLLQRWSLASEEHDCSSSQRRTATGIGFSIYPPPAPLAFNIDNSLEVHRHSDNPSPCTSAGPSNTPHRAASSSGSMKTETSRKIHRQITSILESFGGTGRRRKSRSISPASTLSPPCSAPKNARHRLSLDALSLTSRGRPYPKRDSSQKGIARRDAPKIPRTLHSDNRSLPAVLPQFQRFPMLGFSSPSSPPTALPALSRESSVSSLRSVSSASTYSSDSDLLLTPPLLPTSVLDYPVVESLSLDISEYAHGGPLKGLAINDEPRGAAYLGYSLACGDCEPPVETSTSLFSQLEPAVSLFSEPPLIPTIGPPVLVC